MSKPDVVLGDYPVTAFLRIGRIRLPQTGVVDTFTRYSVLPREIAKAAGVERTGRTGKLHISDRVISGDLVRVRMASLDGRCSGKTTALVPDKDQDWDKGLLLGGEFLQDTKMHVDSKGEAYCPNLRAVAHKVARRKLA